ncbi:MAG: hypothetical protein M9916_06985 [Crocinitomicaceae bacterium]|nr:hypothetical protein [Crocinitomicaceae bacterium]
MSDKKVQHSYYPHLVVGNIAKVSTEIIQKFLVKYDVEPASTLIEELTQASEENESLTAFESIAQGYLDNNADAIHEKSDLLDLFPAFDVAIEILSKNDPDEIPDIEPDNPLFDLIEHESIFWDNTIAHFIIHKINPLTNDLVLVTKFIGILKKIQVTTLASKPEPIKKEELLEYWNKSRVILPKPIFPLPKKATNEPTPPPPVPDTHYEELLEELNLYQSAKEEILSTYEFQTQQLKKAKMSADEYKTSLKNAIETEFLGRNNISPKNIDEELNLAYERYINEPFAEELTVAYYETLSLPTKTVFSNLGIQGNNINVLFAVKKIDAKITSISKELALYAKREKVVLIGNTLISINNAIQEDVICRPKEEAVSHCRLLHQLMADNPEKSYIQILGTGYANVIRQELVRYEADEIAHIENVLAGEKKEKTHRNKKTQEELSFSEHETNQETETNTRTSDRFELSKEVNKLTAQSTQFDAGVSATGFSNVGSEKVSSTYSFSVRCSSSKIASTENSPIFSCMIS